MENLPEEIVNKIYMMRPQHPVVKIIDDARNNMVRTGYGQEWGDFVSLHLRQYKKKCRKTVRHFVSMRNTVMRYKDMCEWDKRKKQTTLPFYQYALRKCWLDKHIDNVDTDDDDMMTI